LSCCGTIEWPQAAVWAPAWAPTTCDLSYVQRLRLVEGISPRVLLISVHIKLAIFTLLLCSSAECSSSDATTASRRCRKRSKHRHEHHGQVRATHSERPAGSGLGATTMHTQRTKNGAACNGLYTTMKYLRGAAGIGLGATTKYFSQCLCALKITLLHFLKN
jgi:hypothetical protein